MQRNNKKRIQEETDENKKPRNESRGFFILTTNFIYYLDQN